MGSSTSYRVQWSCDLLRSKTLPSSSFRWSFFSQAKDSKEILPVLHVDGLKLSMPDPTTMFLLQKVWVLKESEVLELESLLDWEANSLYSRFSNEFSSVCKTFAWFEKLKRHESFSPCLKNVNWLGRMQIFCPISCIHNSSREIQPSCCIWWWNCHSTES